MTAVADVEAIEVRLFLEAIYDRYGYDLRRYEPASIRRRLQSLCAKTGTPHLGELQHRVLHDRDFFAAIVDDLTVQVSDMFRDPAFYRAFREQVVPVLRTYPQVKIWHAGCASGEEVYATAMVLLEEELYERTQLYATDLSTAAVERAREGVYAEKRAVSFAENYSAAGGRRNFADYVTSAYGRVAVKDHVRRNVILFQHDLVTDYALGEMHVIFCRNVLIYFTAELRSRVLDLFGGCLVRGGFLCLGASERLSLGHRSTFSPHVEQNAIYRTRPVS